VGWGRSFPNLERLYFAFNGACIVVIALLIARKGSQMKRGVLTLQPWELRGCRKGRPQQFWQYNNKVKLTQKEGEC
jgi:hypothetical protein